MEHKLTITLPEAVYQPLAETARTQGRTLEELAVERLAETVSRRPSVGTEGKRRGDIRRFFGSVSSGDPRAADNERIDADLAREYGATHDEE
jgi:hypothetical protein